MRFESSLGQHPNNTTKIKKTSKFLLLCSPDGHLESFFLLIWRNKEGIEKSDATGKHLHFELVFVFEVLDQLSNRHLASLCLAPVDLKTIPQGPRFVFQVRCLPDKMLNNKVQSAQNSPWQVPLAPKRKKREWRG